MDLFLSQTLYLKEISHSLIYFQIVLSKYHAQNPYLLKLLILLKILFLHEDLLNTGQFLLKNHIALRYLLKMLFHCLSAIRIIDPLYPEILRLLLLPLLQNHFLFLCLPLLIRLYRIQIFCLGEAPLLYFSLLKMYPILIL
jgi:hypothetical protein